MELEPGILTIGIKKPRPIASFGRRYSEVGWIVGHVLGANLSVSYRRY